MSEGLLTPQQAADYLKVSVRQLRRYPIRRVKMGRPVRYEIADLEMWVALHREGPAKKRAA